MVRHQEQVTNNNTAPSALKSKTNNSSWNAPPALRSPVVFETPTDELANNDNNHNGTPVATSQRTPWMLQLWPFGKSTATSSPPDAIEQCTPHQSPAEPRARDGKS
jgi:hypothetical protein